MTVSRLSAVLILALAAPALAGDVAEQLPADTLAHLRLTSLADLGTRLDGSLASQLWQDPELVAFLAPALEGMADDLAFLVREADEAVQRMAVGEQLPGALTVSLVHVGGDPDDEDTIEVDLALTLELGPDAAAVFEALADKAADSGDEFKRLTRRDRPAFRLTDEDQDGRVLELLLDGERLLASLTTHGELVDLLGEAPARSLADSATFRGVQSELDADDPLLSIYVDVAACLDVARLMVDLIDDDDEHQAELLMETMLGSPMYAAWQGLGWAVVRDGELLRDRIVMHAPDDPEALGDAGPLDDAVARHAALADSRSALFYSTWFDLTATRERSESEFERITALYDELDVELPPELQKGDMLGQLGTAIEDATGIDILGLLEPTLGTRLSLFVSTPPSALSMPDAGLVIDLLDAEAFDELLDVIVVMDDRIDQVNFSRQDHEGHELLTVKLVGAGLPLLPTLVRLDDQLLVTTTALSMKNLLSALASGDHLAADARFVDFAADAGGPDTLAMWCDVGAAFRYLYGFVGMGLGMAGSADAGFTERFDASLLPTGDSLAAYLGLGTMSGRRTDSGLVYEGRSTLANPALGVVGGLLGVAGLVGLSAATEEAAQDAREELTGEQLRTLAKALEAYRTSVGGGSYPDDLVKLVDRGLLSDEELLVDGSDPKPKRTRTGRGDRIPVSYSLGSVAGLPEHLRKALPEDASHLLMTRGAWYQGSRFAQVGDDWEFKRGDARLVLVLGGEHDVLSVLEEDWGS